MLTESSIWLDFIWRQLLHLEASPKFHVKQSTSLVVPAAQTSEDTGSCSKGVCLHTYNISPAWFTPLLLSLSGRSQRCTTSVSMAPHHSCRKKTRRGPSPFILVPAPERSLLPSISTSLTHLEFSRRPSFQSIPETSGSYCLLLQVSSQRIKNGKGTTDTVRCEPSLNE